MVVPSPDHECSLQPFLREIVERLEKVEAESTQLKKTLYGKRSERQNLPRVKTDGPVTPEEMTATVGDVAAGKSLVGISSLIATCEARGLNPFDCLIDALPRVSEHSA